MICGPNNHMSSSWEALIRVRVRVRGDPYELLLVGLD